MKAPFFSIIIPTLNEEKYLPKLLENLSKQTFRNFEVFVVDGKSDDSTCNEAKKFVKKLSVTILVHNVRNVSAQRNFGAKHAKGRYLVFLDADVGVGENFLALLNKELLQQNALFATTRLLSDSKDVSDVAFVHFINLAMEFSVFVDRPFAGGYNFIVSCDVFTKIGGFNTHSWHGEDYELSLKLNKAGYKLKILKKPAIVYSLRRFRHEGKLIVVTKNARAALHLFTKGPITQEIFDYHMGGSRYKFKKKEEIKPQILRQAENKIKDFFQEFLH